MGGQEKFILTDLKRLKIDVLATDVLVRIEQTNSREIRIKFSGDDSSSLKWDLKNGSLFIDEPHSGSEGHFENTSGEIRAKRVVTIQLPKQLTEVDFNGIIRTRFELHRELEQLDLKLSGNSSADIKSIVKVLHADLTATKLDMILNNAGQREYPSEEKRSKEIKIRMCEGALVLQNLKAEQLKLDMRKSLLRMGAGEFGNFFLNQRGGDAQMTCAVRNWMCVRAVDGATTGLNGSARYLRLILGRKRKRGTPLVPGAAYGSPEFDEGLKGFGVLQLKDYSCKYADMIYRGFFSVEGLLGLVGGENIRTLQGQQLVHISGIGSCRAHFMHGNVRHLVLNLPRRTHLARDPALPVPAFN